MIVSFEINYCFLDLVRCFWWGSTVKLLTSIVKHYHRNEAPTVQTTPPAITCALLKLVHLSYNPCTLTMIADIIKRCRERITNIDKSHRGCHCTVIETMGFKWKPQVDTRVIQAGLLKVSVWNPNESQFYDQTVRSLAPHLRRPIPSVRAMDLASL